MPDCGSYMPVDKKVHTEVNSGNQVPEGRLWFARCLPIDQGCTPSRQFKQMCMYMDPQYITILGAEMPRVMKTQA